MWSQERHQRIMSLVTHNQQVNANELAELLNVSRETVRRDLLELEQGGHIARVHGGAVLPREQGEAPFETRKSAQNRAKQEIARSAAALVTPRSSIMMDAGTTTSAFGEALANIPDIMVITNSLDAARNLSTANADIDLILLGGEIVSDVPATYGETTLSEIRRFRVDMTFISPVGLDAKHGAFNFALKEAEVASAMLSQADQNVLLVDGSKLGRTSRIQVCGASEVDVLVTDSQANIDLITPFETIGARIIR